MLQFTLVDIAAFSFMAALLVLAVTHRSDARAQAKRIRRVETELQQVVIFLEAGGPSRMALQMAREAADGFLLVRVFGRRPSDNLLVISQEVDDVIRAQFERLYDACEQNELAGPRWGLLLTVVGMVLALYSREAGTSIDAQLANAVLAAKSTGLGMLVAIIESSTLARHVVPRASSLRDISIRVLTLAASAETHKQEEEIANAA